MVNPNPLQMREIIELVVRSEVAMRSAKGTAPTLVARKAIPLKLPLFSILEMSAKYAKHEGIPSPNEAPNKRQMIIADVIVIPPNKAGSSEVSVPKIIQT